MRAIANVMYLETMACVPLIASGLASSKSIFTQIQNFTFADLFWLVWCQQGSLVANLVNQEFITEYLPPQIGSHTRQMGASQETDMSN